MIADLLTGWAALEAALPGYITAEEYARPEGADEVFASVEIKEKLKATLEEYRFNLLSTAIQVRTRRCKIDLVKVPDNEAATERIDEVWEANEMAVHYPGLIRDTFTYGDAYVQVWELAGDDEDLLTADDDLMAAGVEITTHNPKNVRMMYDPENPRRKAFLINRWCLPKDQYGIERWRVDLWYADTVERWVSKLGNGLEKADGWDPYGDEQGAAELVNPFGEIPWFHHRTDLPYGVPVHKAGYGAQNALVKMLVTQISNVESLGFPGRYGLLDPDAVLDENNDTPQWVDDDDASSVTPDGLDRGGAQSSGMRSGPGTMQTFTGMKEVGQFDAADPKGFLDPAEFYIRLMAQLTTTPLHYFDPSGDVPSGESLKVADAPLTDDVEWLQVLQTGPIRDEWMFALKVLKVKATSVQVAWKPVQSATSLDDWTIIAAKQAAGVPVEQSLQEAGYRPEQVSEWLDADAEAATLAQRVALLGQIGTAIRDMSSGVALGVLSEQDANAAVKLVLAQINASGSGADQA